MTSISAATSTQDPFYTLEDWRGGTRSLPQEQDYWIDQVAGTIPPDLEGTLFRNGPGLLDRGGVPLAHPFDGDGMICAFTFVAGRVHFRNRYVRTEGYKAEEAANRILYRGVFGTQKPEGWLANLLDTRIKNIANTQVIYWGDKLLALWEAALPHRLDAQTLDTFGLDDLDGVLNPKDTFAAHPRLDPQSQRLVNFGVTPGPKTHIHLYEFDRLGKLASQQGFSIPGFAFIHDFALTPTYAIFFQNPVTLNPIPYLLGLRGAAQCIRFNPQQPTRIWLLPRDGGTPRCFTMPACFVFHHANAYEEGSQITIDSIAYDHFPSPDPAMDFRDVDFAALPPSQLWRIQINLEDECVRHDCLDPRCCEFPTLHPHWVGQPYRYVYMAAGHDPVENAPLQALLRRDLATGEEQLWSAAPKGFVSEPVFVPKGLKAADPIWAAPGKEEDGWLLQVVYDANDEKSHLLIFDAAQIGAGPVARLSLRHHIPYGLHGTFTPQVFI